MEKFGVVANDEEPAPRPNKTGSNHTCPCGEELQEDSNVPKCPEHGTEPFEVPKK